MTQLDASARCTRLTAVAWRLTLASPRSLRRRTRRAPRPQATPAPAPRADEPVTFTKHIAPILQQKCQVCHQPNSIAPMSLLTYEDAKEYARRDSSRTSRARVMPPWHIDKTVGIHDFKNDRSLSDEQIATIVRWMDTGMPQGKTEDMPPPVKFADPNALAVRQRRSASPTSCSSRRRTRCRRARRTSGSVR